MTGKKITRYKNNFNGKCQNCEIGICEKKSIEKQENKIIIFCFLTFFSKLWVEKINWEIIKINFEEKCQNWDINSELRDINSQLQKINSELRDINSKEITLNLELEPLKKIFKNCNNLVFHYYATETKSQNSQEINSKQPEFWGIDCEVQAGNCEEKSHS